jgi:hypothetical protein
MAVVTDATGELFAITQLLQQLLDRDREEIVALNLIDEHASEATELTNNPGPGARRLLVARFGQGSDNFAVTTTPQLVLPRNEGRLGGTIVNYGAAAVFLYLCPPGELKGAVGGTGLPRPTIWLAPTGGAWDFRFANALWGGHVTATTAAATSSLAVAEF